MLDSAHKRLVTTIVSFARAKERDASCLDSKFPNSQLKIREGLGMLIQLYVYNVAVRTVCFASVFEGIVALQLFCSSLLYNELSQLYVYIYPLLLGPPLTHLGHQKVPS